jgi:hypothetical protein
MGHYVYYRVHKSPPPVPISSYTYPVYVLTPYLFKIHFSIILPSTPRAP